MENRKAEIKMYGKTAAWLSLDENGYHFVYDKNYLQSEVPKPVSLTLPIQAEPYSSKVMFPFFDGLIPEGWLLDVAEKNFLYCICKKYCIIWQKNKPE